MLCNHYVMYVIIVRIVLLSIESSQRAATRTSRGTRILQLRPTEGGHTFV